MRVAKEIVATIIVINTIVISRDIIEVLFLLKTKYLNKITFYVLFLVSLKLKCEKYHFFLIFFF